MSKALLRKLEHLARKLSTPPEEMLFAPLWISQMFAACCAEADRDIGRPPQWERYDPPLLHHLEEVKGWLWTTLEDFKAAKGRPPTKEEMKRWIAAAHLAAEPWRGMETWPQQESLPCTAAE